MWVFGTPLAHYTFNNFFTDWATLTTATEHSDRNAI
jgi:hypothetical protein